MPDTQRPTAIETITGGDLADALEAAALAVDHHANAINALNVFPVPDGDTGTNMALTLRSAAEGARSTTSSAVNDVAAAAARGALMGARGNSGVIIAQMLRGMANALADHADVDASSLAAALRAGSDAADTAVAKPVEGTILTVAREAAGEAETAASSTHDVALVLERAHSAARAAVARTPDQLPVLKRAGVVDSGAEGYRVFLEGLAAQLRGEQPKTAPAPVDARADLAALHDENDRYGYCTEVLFEGEGIHVDDVRQRVAALGTSVLVVGDPTLLKVHVHTLHPGQVLEIATENGELLNVKIDNIQRQRQELEAALMAPAPEPPDPAPGTAAVAIASGAGFAQLFESLGVVVVDGGTSMNASVEEILDAINRTPRSDVMILPNDKNAVLASEAAAKMADRRSVRVLPTHSMPRGIAAVLSLNPDAPIDANVQPAEDAAGRCHTIALTRAAKDATVDDVRVSQGEIFALLDDRAVAAGATVERVLGAALDALPVGAREVATVYVGASGASATAEGLAAMLTDRLSAPAEIASGGQPRYEYIISIE